MYILPVSYSINCFKRPENIEETLTVLLMYKTSLFEKEEMYKFDASGIKILAATRRQWFSRFPCLDKTN